MATKKKPKSQTVCIVVHRDAKGRFVKPSKRKR